MGPHCQRNYNRIREILAHLTTNSVYDEANFAREAGLSRAELSRILRGCHAPSFAVMLAITQALEHRLGRPIDPRDILNFDGAFPTPSVEALLAEQATGRTEVSETNSKDRNRG